MTSAFVVIGVSARYPDKRYNGVFLNGAILSLNSVISANLGTLINY